MLGDFLLAHRAVNVKCILLGDCAGSKVCTSSNFIEQLGEKRRTLTGLFRVRSTTGKEPLRCKVRSIKDLFVLF